MELTKKHILHSIGMVVVYPFWLVVALLKDVGGLIYVPFDSQRYVNCYSSLFANINNVVNAVDGIQTQSQEVPEREPMGFKVYPSNAPGFPSPGQLDEEMEDD